MDRCGRAKVEKRSPGCGPCYGVLVGDSPQAYTTEHWLTMLEVLSGEVVESLGSGA